MPLVPENILLFVSGLGILQGFLLAALIFFHPKADKSVSVFLSLHIFFMSFVMMMPFITLFISWQRGNLMQPVLLLPAIFLYFYIRSFKEQITFKKVLPHFLVWFVFLIGVCWNTLWILAKYPHVKTPPEKVFYESFNIIIAIIQICLKVIYYLLARRELLSYQKSIQQLYSETSRINLSWARTLLNGYLFIVISGIIIYALMLWVPQHFNLLLLTQVAIATPYIYVASYKGITQPTIWQVQPDTSKVQVQEKIEEVEKMGSNRNNKRIRPTKSLLSEEKSSAITATIIALLEKEKLYQETELSLQQLADKLGIPTYLVSQAINEGLRKTFYDLINGYRVEEAKRLLTDPKNSHYTILSVGFEAGFNSKTAFNTVFKKFTGLTPTEYRDKQREQQTAA